MLWHLCCRKSLPKSKIKAGNSTDAASDPKLDESEEVLEKLCHVRDLPSSRSIGSSNFSFP
jgi:hypothetical protein